MFDYVQKNDGGSLAKPLIICAVGMGIGFGTCGVGLMFGHNGITPIVAAAGSMIFLCSLAGMVVLGLIAIGRALMRFIRR